HSRGSRVPRVRPRTCALAGPRGTGSRADPWHPMATLPGDSASGGLALLGGALLGLELADRPAQDLDDDPPAPVGPLAGDRDAEAVLQADLRPGDAGRGRPTDLAGLHGGDDLVAGHPLGDGLLGQGDLLLGP